jgi:uncharacterized damage-inducible protein DinB
MKRKQMGLAVLMVTLGMCAQGVLAQNAAPQGTTGAQPASGQAPATSVAEILRQQWEASRKQMTAITDAMPDDKFDFRPVPEVRSYGEIVAHFAGENQTWMEILNGTRNMPETGAEFDKLGERYSNLKTKAEIMKALTDTYDYGAKVLASWDETTATGAPAPNIVGAPRWRFVLIQVIGHTKEHYGNLVTYLRLNHIVPPASR